MDYTSNFNFIWLFFFVFRRGKRLKHFFTLYIQNINIYNTLFSHWHAFYTLITHMGPINTYIKYTYTQTHMNSYTRLYNIFFYSTLKLWPSRWMIFLHKPVNLWIFFSFLYKIHETKRTKIFIWHEVNE